MFLLEVIVSSLADALEAVRGGADRLELLRDLHTGGMTPAPPLVREVVRAVDVPVRVMLRESLGYGAVDDAEVRRLSEAAADCERAGASGLVLGFVRQRRVDLDLTRRVLESAGSLPATFHRAFEELEDPLQASDELKTLPQVDRILTNGGAGDWAERRLRLEAWARRAAPEIQLLVGGGIDLESLPFILTIPGIHEIHVGRPVRVPPTPAGSVSAAMIATLRERLVL
jgi:copper homeostasis protein